MSAEGETQIMDAKSLATKYETIMTERGGIDSKPTEERIALIFQLLDDMVPHMGIFGRTISLMKKEIYEAVFSDRLTTDTGKRTSSNQAPIQRVPFFTLVKRVYDKRDEKAEEMQEQIEVLKQKLFDKHVQYEDSVETITNLRNEIDELNSTVTGLEDDIQNLENTVEYQERTMDEERDRADQVQNNLEADIADLKDDLTIAKNEIKYLYKFKDGYDELQDAFTVKAVDMIPTKKKKKEKVPVVATRRAHLISNIESAYKLEEQLLMIQNTTIEEYDDYLEKHKEELISKEVPDGQSQEDFERQEDEIEKVDQELQVKQSRFKKSIDELNTELELIKQHKTMLEEQLQILEENKPAVAAKKKKSKNSKHGATDPSKESLLTDGLDVDEEEAQPDPFIPQERVFSKYAAMMYSSTNQGKTFHEFKDAKYCPSCGEKTVICPHRIRGAEITFPMPHNCTHLKITRPKVKINQQMMDHFFKPFTATTLQTPTTADRKSTGKHRQFEGLEGMGDRELEGIGEGESLPTTPSFLRESPSMGIEAHMKYPLNRIWDDYATRTLLRRVIPRPLTLRRTLSITQQFYAYMLWQDEYGLEDDGFHSILDNMYLFLRERYLKDDVVYLTAYDVITALLEYAPTNRTIQVFANILTGNLDTATFRYILLLSDFIMQVQWRDVEDFRNFAAVVYPFCNEDDLETLHMGFVSFSENKVSAELVYEYVLYIILKYREPRFLDCEAKLITFPAYEPGQMTYKEFSEALDNILSVSNDKLRKRLYVEADCLVQQFEENEEAVPIQKLSQMTSYLSLLQISPVIKESVGEKVAYARDMMMMNAPMTNTIGHGKAMSGYSQSPAGSDKPPIFTMENIRNLAANIARVVGARLIQEKELKEMLEKERNEELLRQQEERERAELVQFDLTDEEKAALARSQAEENGMEMDEEPRIGTAGSDRTNTTSTRTESSAMESID